VRAPAAQQRPVHRPHHHAGHGVRAGGRAGVLVQRRCRIAATRVHGRPARGDGHPHRRHLADDDPRLDAARPGTRRLHGGTMTTPSTAGGAPSRVSAPRGTPAGLTIDGLCKSYGSVRALDDVGFSVRPGEIFGFVGSNGAGKTTTMRIALGVLAADAGEVRIGDRPVDLDVRRTVGYMPEERGLYPKMRVGAQLSYLA